MIGSKFDVDECTMNYNQYLRIHDQLKKLQYLLLIPWPIGTIFVDIGTINWISER